MRLGQIDDNHVGAFSRPETANLFFQTQRARAAQRGKLQHLRGGQRLGAEAVIPSKKNRKVTRDYDKRFARNPAYTPDMFVEAIYRSLTK